MAASSTTTSSYRQLPSVDRLLAAEALVKLANSAGTALVTDMARAALDGARRDIAGGAGAPEQAELVADIARRVDTLVAPRPRRVINAAGVVIHTNLGRAPLSRAAQEAALTVSAGYSDLEYDLERGERGSRHSHPESLLQLLTGADAAIVVNNNASAVLLALSALAEGREVIVSRGESIEIGGRFRIPDVLVQSGARLVEVGTTNRTYVEDYADAITEDTAAILRVHRSNFAMIGFTETPEPRDLAALGRERGILMLNDLGSGALLDTAKYGLAPEPTVAETLDEGADLALFSGDKLLGGPQAGIVVGTKSFIDHLKRHPLARAVRIDKMDLAALTATLTSYIKGKAEEEIPVWRMISSTPEQLGRRARRWLRGVGVDGLNIVNTTSAVGGGSLPGETLPTRALSIPAAVCGEGGTEGLAERLRRASVPVVVRIADDQVLLDPRTVMPDEDGDLVASLREALLAG
ncbi:MAG: L-seryl-tRNA(Sec) selenium transferase [SAR202 cluster bacterium Io17-Chloro-G9]|nr:MAG: L-seryl-tRNA(Sec) selenium transferase [SAR202 cluster bacterium Io17-Chloro-G9]